MKLSIAGTFTVNTVEDGAQGAPAPYYHDQRYAWSSEMTTLNPTVSPSDIQNWETFIPSNSDATKRFLWMRDTLMTYDPEHATESSGYVAGVITYARINGEDGTGFHPKGSVPTRADLNSITQVSVGDAYLVEENGHLYVYVGGTPPDDWVDFGIVKGDDGLTAYIHLAWAHAVYMNGSTLNVVGFTASKGAAETYEYMGVYSDNIVDDSTNPSSYEWTRVQGKSVRLDLDNENDTMLYDDSGNNLSGNVLTSATLYDDGEVVTTGVSFAIEFDETSGIQNDSSYYSISGNTITIKKIDGVSASIMVMATYTKYGTTSYHYALLSITKIVGEAKYDIITTPSAIACNITEGTLTHNSVTVNIRRTTADGTSQLITNLATYGLTLGVQNASGGNVTVNHSNDSSDWIFNVVAPPDTPNEYTVTLSNTNGTLDKETVPVNKSANGVNAVSYWIDYPISSVVLPSDGSSVRLNGVLKLQKRVGSSASYISSYVQLAYKDGNGNIVNIGSRQSIPVAGSALNITVQNTYKAIIFRMYETSSSENVIADKEVVVAKDGQQGPQGIPGAAGQNVVRLDINNQMDALQYLGNENKTGTVRTVATLYDGTSAATGNITWNLSDSNCQAAFSSGSENNPRTIIVSSVSADTGTVTITATYNSTTYAAVFTVVRLVDSHKYALKITPDAIAWNENTDSGNKRVNIQITKYPYNGAPVELTALNGEEDNLSLEVIPYSTSGSAGSTVTPTHDTSNTKIWYFNASPSTIDRYVVNVKRTVTVSGQSVTTLQDTETVPVARVRNGEQGAAGKDAIRLHLDNQMDAIQYNGSGKLRNNDEVHTHATLYQGGTPVSANAVTWSFLVPQGSGTGYMEAPSTKENPKEFGITAITGTKVEMTITATYNQVAYTAVFTAVKLVDTDKYQIELTPKSIAYNGSEAEDENYPFDIRIKKWSAFGGDPVYIEDDEFPSNSVLKITAYDSWGQYSPTTVTPTHVKGPEIWTVTTDCEDYDSYEVELVDSTNSDLVYDHQTLPISRVYNGEKGSNGQDALVADLSNEMDSVGMTYEGKVLGEPTLTTTVSMYYGSQNKTITSLSFPQGSGWTYSSSEDAWYWLNPDDDFVRVRFQKLNNTYTGLCTIEFLELMTLPDDCLTVPILASCVIGSTTYTRQADFTIQGVRAGAEGESPIIYQLSMSGNEIKVDKNGTRTPTTISVGRMVISSSGATSTTHGSVWYSKDNAAPVRWISGGNEDIQKAPDFQTVNNRITFYYYDGTGTNANTNSTLLDTESIPVVYDGDDGEDPYWIDIQTRTTRVDKNGNPYISITWYVRKGDEIIPNNEGRCYLKLNTDSDWTGAGVDEGGGYLFDNDTVDGSGGALTANTNTVLIRYEDNNNVARASISLPITRDGIDGGKGADAVEYLVETERENIVIPQGSNSVTETSTIYIKKRVAGVASTYSAYVMICYRKSDGLHYHYHWTSPMGVINNKSFTVDKTMEAVVIFANSSPYGSLTQQQLSGTSVVPMPSYIAKTEIAINKQGDNGSDGSDAVSYEIVVVEAEAYVDASGIMHGNVLWDTYKITGSSRQKVDPTSVTGSVHQYKLNTDNNWISASVEKNHDYTEDRYDALNWKLEGSPTLVELRYVMNGTRVAYASVPFTITGQMGRNYYYDGEYSSTKVYVLTDYSAPFVSYKPSGGTLGYYVLTGANGSQTRPAPSNNVGNPWELMENSFKYLITEAFFTQFAKLGAAVFNQDYMFSQHGYIVGYEGMRRRIQDGSQYQYVKPDDMGAENMDDSTTDYKSATISSTSFVSMLSIAIDDAQDDGDMVAAGRWCAVRIQYQGTNYANTKLTISLYDADNGSYLNMYGIDGQSKQEHVFNTTEGGTAAFLFQFPNNTDTVQIRGKVSSRSVSTYTEARLAKFTPTYYLNLRTGQMVANDVTARGAIYATEGEFNGKLSIGSGDKFIVDPNTGELTMNGYSQVEDAQTFPVDTSSDKIDLLKLFYQFDPDSLARIARLLLNSKNGNVTLDAQYGFVSTDGAQNPTSAEISQYRGIRLRTPTSLVTINDGEITITDYTRNAQTLFDGRSIYWYSNGIKTAGGVITVDANGFLKVLQD